MGTLFITLCVFLRYQVLIVVGTQNALLRIKEFMVCQNTYNLGKIENNRTGKFIKYVRLWVEAQWSFSRGYLKLRKGGRPLPLKFRYHIIMFIRIQRDIVTK